MTDRTPPRKESARTRRHTEDILDEALEESFPASDPPSPTRPHDLDAERRVRPGKDRAS